AGGPSTRIDREPFEEQPAGRPEDMRLAEIGMWEADESGETPHLIDRRLRGPAKRDFGKRSALGPTAGYRGGVGLVAGARASYTSYGFLREPHAYHVQADALYAIESDLFGLELYADRRLHNSRIGYDVTAAATQFESFHFFGFGNDSPRSDDSRRVRRDAVLVQPAVYWEKDATRIGIGPVFRYGRTRERAGGTPLDVLRPLGTGDFAQAGVRLAAHTSRNARGTTGRSYAAEAAATVYPAVLDAPEPFATAHAEARASVPLRSADGPFVSLR